VHCNEKNRNFKQNPSRDAFLLTDIPRGA